MHGSYSGQNQVNPQFANFPPQQIQQVTYIRQSGDQGYINGSQPPPITYQGGQTVTYVTQPTPSQIQPQPQPQSQMQIQPQQIPQVKPSEQQTQFAYQHNTTPGSAGQVIQNRTTTSNYTYTQYPPANQYVPSGVSNQYAPQTVTYVKSGQTNYANSDGGERQKSTM